jgi:hypothetical protein
MSETLDPRAQRIGTEMLRRLAAQAERERFKGAQLRAEIRAIMAAHTGSERLTAEGVRAQLTRCPLPTSRAIRRHMQAIRSAANP